MWFANQIFQHEAPPGDLLIARLGILKFACVFASVAVACVVNAQTYQVGPDASKAPQVSTSQVPSSGQPLGWGSNIQNARLARAAQLALQHGDHALALDYAQRAAQAAPSDPQLWFLLGYAARLSGKFQQSIDAYNRGLRLTPSSLDGLSGLAQSYSAMGRTDESERLLKQVITADPKRKDDALLLGDLYMRSADYAGAIEWLGRAERIHPGARSELLMAISYQHLKQMDLANRYLDMARRRDPDNPDVQRTLVGYYRENGSYAEAIAALKAIHNPRPDVTAELAYTYQLNGQLSDSAKLYAQAANAMPRDLGLQLSAAQAEVAADSIKEADGFLSRAAAIDAGSYRLHAIRAEIAQFRDHDNEAIQEYRAALAKLPESPAEGPLYRIQLHMDLMALYQNISDTSSAHEQLAIAQTEISGLGDGPSNRPQFLRLRSLVKMNAGDLSGALSDIKEALATNSHDRDNLQLNGDILMKQGRIDEAIATYRQILAIDATNRFALISLGYASRAAGRDLEAENYFLRLEQTNPSLYVPYLALGDLYTTRRDFTKAQASYSKGYGLAPGKPLIVAGGMNAAIEAHDLNLAAIWLGRATNEMAQEPQILREKERYLSFKGQDQQSADVAQQAIKVLPHDRDVVVYFGYDLLHLARYDELLALTSQYSSVFPKEADIPLLQGYVHKHNGALDEASQDFTEALRRNPEVVTAYVNRGYVLNDLHKPQKAAPDFEEAIKREPDNGEAHLGLAYVDLDLHKPQAALRQAEFAEHALGDSRDIHLIRATAYSREDMLTKAAIEYEAALKFTPNDGALHLGLGNIFFAERRYHDAIGELVIAEKFSPENPDIYASLARTYANLDDRDQTLRYVQLAEEHVLSAPLSSNRSASSLSEIWVSIGEALSTIGDQKAAMERFQKALAAPGSDRVAVRLAIAQLMSQQDHQQDAERQIALAMMESEGGEAEPPTGSQFIAAADVFRLMHDYQLSDTYLQHAKAAGAPDAEVRIGLANNYLALGDTVRAQAELSAVKAASDDTPEYQYLLAEANIYRQQHHSAQALTPRLRKLRMLKARIKLPNKLCWRQVPTKVCASRLR